LVIKDPGDAGTFRADMLKQHKLHLNGINADKIQVILKDAGFAVTSLTWSMQFSYSTDAGVNIAKALLTDMLPDRNIPVGKFMNPYQGTFVDGYRLLAFSKDPACLPDIEWIKSQLNGRSAEEAVSLSGANISANIDISGQVTAQENSPQKVID